MLIFQNVLINKLIREANVEIKLIDILMNVLFKNPSKTQSV